MVKRSKSLLTSSPLFVTPGPKNTAGSGLKLFGYIGWAHPKSEPDDSIYLLPGCSIPVVLRARDGGRFTVLGDTWVRGVMEGERVKPDFSQTEILQGATIGSKRDAWTEIEIY
jgi:hypothetical protein